MDTRNQTLVNRLISTVGVPPALLAALVAGVLALPLLLAWQTPGASADVPKQGLWPLAMAPAMTALILAVHPWLQRRWQEAIDALRPLSRQPEIVEQPTTPGDVTDLERASTEEMAIRMEGLRRDYPQYYAEIVRQINRCFRWTGGGRWNTVIRFEIQRDGRIPGSSIQFFTRSGNGTFDIQALGAVECAGAGRLMPLPEDLPYDALPVQFTFSPA